MLADTDDSMELLPKKVKTNENFVPSKNKKETNKESSDDDKKERIRKKKVHKNFEIALKETSDDLPAFDIGIMAEICKKCNALYFPEEKNAAGIYPRCCNSQALKSDFHLGENKIYPQRFSELFDGISIMEK